MPRPLMIRTVLILPVQELSDLWRLQQIGDQIIKDIVTHRIRAVVFDFSDVTALNDSVASQLAQMMNAYQHLGVIVVTVRLSPVIENVLNRAGLIIDDVIPMADLEAGVEEARRWAGLPEAS